MTALLRLVGMACTHPVTRHVIEHDVMFERCAVCGWESDARIDMTPRVRQLFTGHVPEKLVRVFGPDWCERT